MGDTRDKLTKRYSFDVMFRSLGHTRDLINPNLVRVTVPTLPYASFDSAGEKVLPWHLMKFIDSNEVSVHWPLRDEKSPILIYLVYYELKISASLYDTTKPKHPLVLESSYRYVKQSSRALLTTLRHPTQLVPYAEAEYIEVMVDSASRKPKPFPVWWKERHGIPSEGRRKEHTIPKKPESSKTIVTEHKVSYSDVDGNGHANYTFYARVGINTFVENLLSGRLNKHAGMHFTSGLKKLQMTFNKECLMGDIVKCESWEDELSTDTCHCHVILNGVVCTKLTLVWHTTPSLNAPIHKM